MGREIKHKLLKPETRLIQWLAVIKNIGARW